MLHLPEMPSFGCANYNEWRIMAFNKANECIRDETFHNLVVDAGRDNLAKGTLNFDTSPVEFTHMGVGASATAAAYTQTTLVHELIGNANRIAITQANAGSTTFTNSDITTDQVTVSGYTFRKKVIIEAIYDFTDGNNGHTFQEYGLFSTGTLPATPTSTSGTMYCRLVDPSPIAKNVDTKIIVQVNMRW